MLTGESWPALDNRAISAVESGDAERRQGDVVKRIIVLAVVLTATAAIAQLDEWAGVASASLLPSGMPGRKVLIQR